MHMHAIVCVCVCACVHVCVCACVCAFNKCLICTANKANLYITLIEQSCKYWKNKSDGFFNNCENNV